MSDRTEQSADDLKTGLEGVRGVGDAIRGTVTEATDRFFGDKEGEARDKAIKNKGMADVGRADAQMSGSQTTATGTSTTGAGAHSGAVSSMGSNTGHAQSNLPTESTTTSQRF